MAAAARLPACAPTTAAPVELDPDAVFVADEPLGVADARIDVRPKLEAAAAPEADVTIVWVQEHEEL
jgi:hypothetical protein